MIFGEKTFNNNSSTLLTTVDNAETVFEVRNRKTFVRAPKQGAQFLMKLITIGIKIIRK